MDDCKAPDDPSPSIPTRYTGTAGERPEGLPVDLGGITEATIDLKKKNVDENNYMVYHFFFNVYLYLVDVQK